MREWKPILIPLDRGLGQDSAKTADGVSFERGVNLDFGRKDAVRGRACYVRPTGGFDVAGQVSGAGIAPTFTNKATLAATGYTAQEIFSVADKRSERPALLTNGRTFTQEADGTWVDRYGAMSCRVDRVANFLNNLPGGLPASFNPAVLGFDFGPGEINSTTSLLTTQGNTDVTIAGPDQGPGTSALSGSLAATVHVPTGTSNLVLTTHQQGARAVSTVTLATDAATPNGHGNNPIICADAGLAGYYVAYVTTTAHTVKLLQVTAVGGITTSATVTFGAGTITNLWICNSDAPVKVVLAMIDSSTLGITTKIYSSALVDQSLDAVLHGTGTYVQVTCGAARASTADVWLTSVDNGGGMHVDKRALTATTTADYGGLGGTWYGFTGAAASQGAANYLQHQPVLFNGRVLAGVAVIRAWSNIQGGSQTATWYVIDLTDRIVGGTNLGARQSLPMVARGTLDGSLIPWNPASAMVASDGLSYRFATADWTTYSGGLPNITAITGYDAVLGLNEISAQPPQVAHIGRTTVIGGSIPRAISEGSVYELGFPYLGFPAATFAPSSTGGSWASGSYTMQACWAWTDESGQVHRSAPSIQYTASVSAGQQITFFGSPYFLTDKTLVQSGDRGYVWLEFYITEANPVDGAPLYLAARVAAETGTTITSGLVAGPTDTTRLPLYTVGGILANLPVSADGGVVAVGRRCWVSDGDYLYASKLGFDGDPPSWNGDQDARSGGASGPLTVVMPAGAGRILALSEVDGRVVALCERGIYVIAGDGPDDTGSNSDFTSPLLVSQLGVAGPRAVTSTPRGAVFQSAHQQLGDSVQGGLWLLDKSLQIAQLTWPAREAVDTNQAGRLTYIPERGLVVFVTPAVPGQPSYVGGGNTGAQLTLTLPYLVVWDLHVNTWCVWTAPPDGLLSCAAVAGYLWTCGADAGGFTASPGTGHDAAGGVNTNITMELQTNDLAAGGDVLAWSRVRSLRVVGDTAPLAHTLVVAYTQDDAVSTNTTANGTHSFALPANQQQTTGWPSDRYAPEWRIPHQKCSTIQVDLQATPAVAVWTHLELQVKPERRAPAHFRA